MNSQVLTQLLFLGVLVAAFWFLLIRPQQQQRKKHDEMVAALQPGTRVLTIGGIFGTVKELEGDNVLLEIADGVDIEMVRGAVGNIVSGTDVAEAVAANESEGEETGEHTPSDEEEPPMADDDEKAGE